MFRRRNLEVVRARKRRAQASKIRTRNEQEAPWGQRLANLPQQPQRIADVLDHMIQRYDIEPRSAEHSGSQAGLLDAVSLAAGNPAPALIRIDPVGFEALFCQVIEQVAEAAADVQYT